MLRRRRPIVCQEAVELVTDYLEDALSARDRARFEAHLGECPHCREYLRQMRVTLDVLGRLEADALAPAVREEMVALYRRWRDD